MGRYSLHHGYKKTNIVFKRISFLGVAFLSFGLIVFLLNSPPPTANTAKQSVQPASVVAEEPKVSMVLPWPEYGHSAYAVADTPVVAGSQENPDPVPIASLAKVITALAIINHKPLQVGEQGPMITLNETDAGLYEEYLRKNGSVVPVEAGERISQYQAMQAMLMMSANNMTDSLTVWAFGSMDEYKKYANDMIKSMGLKNTTVDDASGFSPLTESTSEEMARIGLEYMKNPVLREIATKPNAIIPVAGTIPNYNAALNEPGVYGIKVGDTDEAKRCFMIANVQNVDSDKENISVAVILGAETLQTAMIDAKQLLKAGNQGFQELSNKGLIQN